MIDLWTEPHSESGEYDVFFGNITGHASMVTVMRKNGNKINEAAQYGPRTAFVAFVDVKIPGDEPEFSWHDNVKELSEKPFTEEWALEQYKRHLWLALHEDGVDYHGEDDAKLILEHGIDELNFTPSTPPKYR